MDGKTIAIGILIVTNLLAGVAYINASAFGETDGDKVCVVEETLGTVPAINVDRAINITAENETIKEFTALRFNAPDRRSVHVALVQNSTYNSTGASVGVNESPFLWKVDMIERSCSCGSRGKDLYVATALVNPQTGKIVSVETYAMPETTYGRNICADACHR
ncbi:MAG: hypothetical protein ACXQTY_06445 [Candidatus Methanogasteraceae archaeon]